MSIELDEDLIRRARERAAADATDAEAIEAAVAAFLGFAALDEAHAQDGLPEDEANRLAVDEVRDLRARRG